MKCFWSKVKDLVFASLSASFQAGEMSPTQKRAVISVIHKGKDLPRDNLNNWRPISLTNTDYKIFAKCLAHRLGSVVSSIISEDQVGFIKGRKASDIIRLIDDVTDFINCNNKPGILIGLDFARAFDSISKEYMIWAFTKIGFGGNFLNWVKVLMNNTTSCINYVGRISEEFDVLTGIRQGCNFSPMAFVLGLELLAIKIRSDQTIKGLNFPSFDRERNMEYVLKLAMYADDVTLFLKDKHDLQQVLLIVKQFSYISNLNLNQNKTEAMWLGSMKNSPEQCCNIRWETN